MAKRVFWLLFDDPRSGGICFWIWTGDLKALLAIRTTCDECRVLFDFRCCEPECYVGFTRQNRVVVPDWLRCDFRRGNLRPVIDYNLRWWDHAKEHFMGTYGTDILRFGSDPVVSAGLLTYHVWDCACDFCTRARLERRFFR